MRPKVSHVCGYAGVVVDIGDRRWFYYEGNILAYSGPNGSYRLIDPPRGRRSRSTINTYMRHMACSKFQKVDADEFNRVSGATP